MSRCHPLRSHHPGTQRVYPPQELLQRIIVQRRLNRGVVAENAIKTLRRVALAGLLFDHQARDRACCWQLLHRMRVGHVTRIEEIQAHISRMSPKEKRQVASELSARYRELKLDLRIERLDKAAAANERRVSELTKQAEAYLAEHNHKKLVDVLNDAKKLQGHNSRLLKAISRTEARLLSAAKHIAQKPGGVKVA